MAGTLVVERRLASEASSVAEARRVLRQAVADAATPGGEWVDDALVVMSEIVTNALVHAGTPIGLTIRVDDAGVRVEVADGSRHQPQPRDYAVTAGTGRGLSLVDELVRAWGTDPGVTGKVVWFELGSMAHDLAADPAGHAGAPRRAGHAPGRTVPPDALHVELLDVPLVTHADWQEHAASILREYLLATLDDAPEDFDVFEAHAAASDAMSVLFEQIPAPAHGDVPGGRVVLRMPVATAASFRRLDELLDAASDLADTEGWVATPIRPELRNLRRWICGEVRRQQQGGTPRAWPSPDDLPGSAA